jgi:hypothetical protein
VLGFTPTLGQSRVVTLDNRKNNCSILSNKFLKKKNKVEEGGALGSGVKKKYESTYLRAKKMMRGKVEPYVVSTMIRIMPIVVLVVR